jgi:hypothetical protein
MYFPSSQGSPRLDAFLDVSLLRKAPDATQDKRRWHIRDMFVLPHGRRGKVRA